jgi:hypothetical protein
MLLSVLLILVVQLDLYFLYFQLHPLRRQHQWDQLVLVHPLHHEDQLVQWDLRLLLPWVQHQQEDEVEY